MLAEYFSYEAIAILMFATMVLMLLTGGVCGILALIDFIRILTGSLKMADGKDLV